MSEGGRRPTPVGLAPVRYHCKIGCLPAYFRTPTGLASGENLGRKSLASICLAPAHSGVLLSVPPMEELFYSTHVEEQTPANERPSGDTRARIGGRTHGAADRRTGKGVRRNSHSCFPCPRGRGSIARSGC